jgi:hypothetical protein
MRRIDGAGGRRGAGRLTRRVLTLGGISITLVMLMASSALAFAEVGDAPSLPPGQPVPAGTCEITGTLSDPSDEDFYAINVTDPANFSARTEASGTVFDPILTLTDNAGVIIDVDDDGGGGVQSLIGPFGGPPGTYHLAISSFHNFPVPSSPGQVITGWQNDGIFAGPYTIRLTGVAGCAPEAAGSQQSATLVLCAEAPGDLLSCEAMVGDATAGTSAEPAGVVAFFAGSISTNTFLGQCTLQPVFGAGGLAKCGSDGLDDPPGTTTIWAVYYPAGGSPYQISVDSDDVNNADVDNPERSDTKGLCVSTAAAGVAQQLTCHAIVADDDNDVSPDPAGVVAFFSQAVSSNNFIGQCTLGPSVTGGPALAGGISQCGTTTSQLAGGPVTGGIWTVYYPTNNYSGSVGGPQTFTV